MLCVGCKKQFIPGENYGDAQEGKKIIERLVQGDVGYEIAEKFCPDCLAKFNDIFYQYGGNPSKLKYRDANDYLFGNSPPKLNISDILLRSASLAKKRRPAFDISGLLKKIEIYLAKALIAASAFIFVYSLAFKFLPLNLETFPFYPYIIAYSCFIFIAQFKKFNPLYLIIVLLNFTSPVFRNIFFSYFDRPLWALVWAILFILSNISAFILIVSFISRRRFVESRLLSGKEEVKHKGQRVALYLSIILYFGLVSPFHLKVIKPNIMAVDSSNLDSDKLYTETTEVDKKADQQIAYQYLSEGKGFAARGTRAGFIESIQSYKRALELFPNSSNVYAEMAYSYASIARILAWNGTGRKEVEENFNSAKKAMEQAIAISANDPTSWSVGAILDAYQGNNKNALRKLQKAEELAKKNGFSDRFLEAKSLLGRKYDEKIGSLMSINEKIDPNNAELLNRLGVLYYNINNKVSAKRMFEKAISLSPDYGESYLNLALVSPVSKRFFLWKEAAAKDDDLKFTVDNYITLSRMQNWFRIGCLLWVAFAIIFIVLFFSMAGGDKQKEDKATDKGVAFILFFASISLSYYLLYYGIFNILFVVRKAGFLLAFCLLLYIIFVIWTILIAREIKAKVAYAFFSVFWMWSIVTYIYVISKQLHPVAVNTISHRFLSLFPFF